MFRRPLTWLLVPFLLVFPFACARDDATALVGLTVLDGLGNPPKADQVLVLRGDRIAEILPREEFRPTRGTRVIDLTGRFVMPALVDTHAHVTVLPLAGDGGLAEEIHLADSEQVLQTLVAFGIMTVRNPAAPTEAGVALRDRVASGELKGPRILTAGHALNRAQAPFGPFVATPNEESVRSEVQRQAALGVDLIKIYSSLSPDLVGAAIEEAHGLGLPVVGHLQRTSWTEAASLGIDAITHGAPWSRAYLPEDLQDDYRGSLRDRIFWIENVDFDGPEVQEMIELLVDRQIPVDPTLIAYHTKFFGDSAHYLQNPEMQLAPNSVREMWQQGTFVDDWSREDFERAHRAWPRVLEWTRRLHEAGVLLAAGSDFPNPWILPGAGLHQELRLLHDAGIPPLDVLRIATWNGARTLGLEDEIGSIEVGKRADLVILTADPSKNLHATRAISHLFQGGEFLDPAALLSTSAP